MSRENSYGRLVHRRRKRQKGTEHARKATCLEISLQTVLQDQEGVAWSRLDCFKPSFLALTAGVCESWLETHTEETYRCWEVGYLYSLDSSQRIGRCDKETNGNLNHSKVQNESETEIAYVRKPEGYGYATLKT